MASEIPERTAWLGGVHFPPPPGEPVLHHLENLWLRRGKVQGFTGIGIQVVETLPFRGLEPLPLADSRRPIAAPLPEHFGARRRLLPAQRRQHVEAVELDPRRSL